jgi:hypothetical protein
MVQPQLEKTHMSFVGWSIETFTFEDVSQMAIARSAANFNTFL